MLNIVAAHFKTLVSIFMVLLVLGTSMPQPAFAAGQSHTTKSCCKGCHMACCCHSPQACGQTCQVAQVPPANERISVRTALSPSPRVDFSLFTLVPIKDINRILISTLYRRELHALLPFGGDSPQAVLRLWLI